MTDDNSNTSNDENLVDMDDLDAFEDVFYNRETKATEAEEEIVEEADEEEVAEIEDDALATEDTDAAEADEDEPEEEVAEEQPKPKKNRKSYQERIDELTRQAREAQRERDDLLIRLEERTRKTEVTQEEATPLRDILPADAPNPDALDKDGKPVYALGEFDPRYITDLTRFTIQKETTAQREKDAQESRNREVFEAQNALKASWAEKVEQTKEEIPEIVEEIGTLVDTFQKIDPGYGEYLAMTIMSAENGPEIMHYLSQNIGEAQKIVASGPAAATRAIGRLEGMLLKEPEAPRNTKRVSDAPPPPKKVTKGQGSRTTISPDTDDLDAFEKIYFAKKR